ncbi:MAG: DUF3365 domain-containing protein, partial [Phycisphaerales bacterium]|nr:DUF3365 domain-containing protein [Phycisphaerales bacterium]
GVTLTAEAVREEMATKWEQGIFTAKLMREWADAGEIKKILTAVPIVTAWHAAELKAKEGGFQFRVPKFQPRNAKNEPDEFESTVLKKFEHENIQEFQQYDPKLNAIRYFRPIKLTQECLLCHGDPKTSEELWGNDKGLDPTGVKMENWKVGEVHGAFEIIQSLNDADAKIAGALQTGGLMVGALTLVAATIFFFLSSRGIEGLYRPIRRIASQLNEGANQVADASNQLAAASQSLAEGASTQASSLQETSSSLEEMSAMTRTNAENAGKANDLAARARNNADQGDKTMTQLNSAMDSINQSSTEISKIIKVIEEIAFQTNLLALNAAVEAARAGEHGKGFAVVAEEVRNLAQRSAQAAKDTTNLIEGSVQRAREGAAVAHDASSALQSIINDVAQVAELLGGINQASREQAQGVEQVNIAVSSIDKVTQQNASNAEESASASEELRAQAESVKAQVNELLGLVGSNKGGESPSSYNSSSGNSAGKKGWLGRSKAGKTQSAASLAGGASGGNLSDF